ncbi:uroporphyrinogen-III synthase [Chitinibacter sp. S2-10]|uniref:uroporphyrinogen-III synthase n=1 Tax=Chitinibacter sp. S2-10 TaxID=3373597 RepID=UPI0039772F73
MTEAASQPLQGRRLWVTRPAAQAAELVLALNEQGAEVVTFPLLNIAPPPDPQALENALAQLESVDLAIFISPSAIDAVFSRLSTGWPEHVPVAVIGPGSAKRAQALGIQTLISPQTQFDSEGLLAMPQLHNLANQRIMIFRGQGGRDLLPQALAERGAQIELVSAYQRQAPGWTAEELIAQLDQGCDGLIVSSSEAAQHLFAIGGELARHRLQSVQYFAPHPRIINALQAQGACRTALTQAGDSGITRSICLHFSEAAGTALAAITVR